MARFLFFISLFLAVVSAPGAEPTPRLLIDLGEAAALPAKEFSETGEGVRQVPRAAATVVRIEEGAATPPLRATLRARGGSSLNFPHPTLALRLKDDGAAPLPGLAPGRDWVLITPNPAFDRTLLANPFAWELQRAAGHWSPAWRFADVEVRWRGGSDRALRLVVERVDAARLGIAPLPSDGAGGGWLLQLNRRDPVSVDGLPPHFFHTPGRNGRAESQPDLRRGGDDEPRHYAAVINFESPDGPDLLPEQRTVIEAAMAATERALFAGDDSGLDWNAWADAWWLNQLCATPEFAQFNLWVYRARSGAPVSCFAAWDFDRAFQGDPESADPRGPDRFWFAPLNEDAELRNRLRERWRELRAGPWSDAALEAILAGLASRLNAAALDLAGAEEHDRRMADWKVWLLRRAEFLTPQ
jgi:hypothetical protein